MKLHRTIYGKGEFLQCNKVKRPKFSSHRGRTWDFEIVNINNSQVKMYFDTTWGGAYYFEWMNEWYRMSMWQGASFDKRHPSMIEHVTNSYFDTCE